MMLKNILKLLPHLLLFSIVLIWGLGMSIHVNDDGSMSDCPFMGHATLCKMALFYHLKGFQGMFSAVTYQTALLSLFGALMLVSTVFSKEIITDSGPPKFVFKYISKPQDLIFNKLLLAVSDGIVQPKLYA